MDYSLQLYSIREETGKDFKSAILEVGKLGYKGVEFAGYGGLSSDEMKKLLDDANLYSVGSHTSLDILENSFAEDLEYHKKLGSKYIVCPYGVTTTEEKLYHLIDVLNKASNMAKGSGIKIGYHNHQHEFNKIGDKLILDIIAENTSEDIIFELDVFWVAYAGIDPFELIKKLGSRVELIHVKQIGKDNKNVEVSEGDIDVKEIIKAAKYAKYFVVEQEEYTKPIWETTKNNIDYLLGV